MKKQSLTPTLLLLLVSITLIRGLIYASVTPPWWQSHDEEFHFAQIRLLVGQWTTASPLTQDWPQEMAANFAAFPASRWTSASTHQPNLVNISDRYASFVRPSLSYYLYAWPGNFLIHQDILLQLLTLRLVSVFITGGVIIFAFLSARQIFPEALLTQIMVPWLVLFTPSFMIINSAINDGNLTVLLATVIFYLLLLETSQSRIGRRTGLALVLTVLAFWSKSTAYFLIIGWGFLLLWYVWKFGPKYWLGIGVAGIALFLSFFLLPEYHQNKLTSVGWYATGLSLKTIEGAFLIENFRDMFAGYWGILGYFIYRLDQIWYTLLFLFSAVAAIGLLFHLWLWIKKKDPDINKQKGLPITLLFAGTAMVIWFGVAVFYHNKGFSVSLARYLFPAIVPFSILMIAGWQTLLPKNWRNICFLFIAGAFFLFDTLVWLNYALPWYYPFWP
ncbi:MAG: hypothetical protein JW953_06655 [Anaerolineae bacterium]|nr:hypothetical protein [Anaerolineae bacterium]